MSGLTAEELRDAFLHEYGYAPRGPEHVRLLAIERAATAPLRAEVEALRVLSEAATPGEWRATLWYVSAPDVIVHGPALIEQSDTVPETVARWKADAALIAAAVNLIRAALARTEAP